jgi:hypothetical protein
MGHVRPPNTVFGFLVLNDGFGVSSQLWYFAKVY